MKIKIRRDNIEEWCFAISAFCLSAPFFLWNSSSNIYFFVIATLLVFHNWDSNNEKVKTYLPLFLCLYVVVSLRSNFTIWGILTVFLFWTIFNVKKSFLSNSFSKYRILFSITIIPSVIVYILLLLGVDMPSHTIDPTNSIKDGYYRVYPFMIIYEYVQGYPLFRFHGYYDEPGIIGTISGILLITDRLNLRNKWNIPIFVSGLLSLSLYFYVIIIFYILIFSKLKIKLLSFAFGVVLLYVFMRLDNQNFTFLERFVLEDGKFAGDTRTSHSFDVWFQRFTESIDFWIGCGGNKAQEVNMGGSSYKDLIVNYGCIFFVSYLFSFLSYIINQCQKVKPILICSVLFLSCIYQRPAIYDYFYLFLWCGMVCSISNNDSEYLIERYNARR